MRHLVIILSFCILFAGSAASQVRQLPKPVSDSTTGNLPKPPGRVSDCEQVFTPVQIGQLNSLIRRFQEATTNEIAGITIDSSRVKKEAFDDYTLAIARQWGVGNKQLNNGILTGFSTGYRKIRIRNGSGMEVKRTAGETAALLKKYIIPPFKKSHYFEGIKSGLLAIREAIRQGGNAGLGSAPGSQRQQKIKG